MPRGLTRPWACWLNDDERTRAPRHTLAPAALRIESPHEEYPDVRYCNWPTKQTDYSMRSSPVKRDAVGEVAAACQKHGVTPGFYYLIRDRHEPTHNDKDPEKYVRFMRAQLTELLSNYGPVCEIWFDGGWAKREADWNIPSLYQLSTACSPAAR